MTAADQSPTDQVSDVEVREAVFEALRNYTMTNMDEGDGIGAGYPLVDLMSNDGTTIDTGEAEMRILADHISEHLALIARSQPKGADIGRMVDRFLSWKLPEDFGPDGGVIFDKSNLHPAHWPSGTNLLDHTQATAMVRHMLEGEG